MTNDRAIGSVIGGCRVEAVLNRGGMGVVYRAVQLGLDRVVALKLVAPALAHDETFRRRFQQEARLAASVKHPNVVQVHDAGEEPDGRLYLVMELIEGSTLRKLLEEEGRLEPSRAGEIVGQLADALDAAHAAGLVHRDVKPENVLLDAAGRVYLTDFGLTKRTDATHHLTASGQGVGTPDYAAPEQITGERVDAGTDVYALGCVLFEMLAGAPPYRRHIPHATLQAHLSDPIPALTALRPELPAAFDEIVANALAKSGLRYASAGDFARAVEAAVQGRPLPSDSRAVATGEAATQPLSQERRSRAGAWLGAVGALVLAAGLATVLVNLPDGSGSPARQPGTSTVVRRSPRTPGTTRRAQAAFVPFNRAAYSVQRPADWRTEMEERPMGASRFRSRWASSTCSCDLVVDWIAGYRRTAMQNASEVPGGVITQATIAGFDDAALRVATRGSRHLATLYVAFEDDNYAIRASAPSAGTARWLAERVASSLSPRTE